MKKFFTIFFFAFGIMSSYAGNLLLTNFEDVTCFAGTSGGITSSWATEAGAGKIAIPANNQGEYIYFSLPANFDVNLYGFLKIKVKSSQTAYRFVPELLTSAWSGSADWTNTFTYSGNGAWQDIYISLSGMTAGSAGTYDKIALKPAVYDSKPGFDLYIDDVTFIEKYVPDYSTNVIISNFDNVISTMGGWSNNTVSIASNPNGSGNVGYASIPANNDGGISFSLPSKINTTTHDKISVRVYGSQTFNLKLLKLEDASNGAIKYENWNTPEYSTPNSWQTLTFDISDASSNSFNKLIFQPEAWNNKPAFTFYIDDITLLKAGATPLSMVKADDGTALTYNTESKVLLATSKGEARLRVVALTGTVIKDVDFVESACIDFNGSQNGIYLVSISNGTAQKSLKLLVK